MKKTIHLLMDQQFRFKPTLKHLLQKGVLTNKEYERLLKFNDLRDLMIHRLLMYGYRRTEMNRVEARDAANGFKDGVELVLLLKNKTVKLAREL